MSTDKIDVSGLTPAEIAALNDDEGVDERTQPDTADADVLREEMSRQTMIDMAREVAPPDQIEQGIQQLRHQRDALEAAYEEGESDLTHAEFQAKVRELGAQIFDLNADLAEARLITRMASQAATEDWRRQVADARKEAKSMGLDLRPGSDAEAQWDRCVKYLGNDPDNADKPAEWFLKTALQMVAARHDKLDAGHFSGGEGRASAPRGLDGLKGLELERALARMSPEQAEAWLQS